MYRSDERDEWLGRLWLALVIGLAVTALRLAAAAAGGVPRPLWFAALDLAVTVPTLGLGLPLLAQAIQTRRAQAAARRLGGRGWECQASGAAFGLANPWVPGVLVAGAQGTEWHPLRQMPGVSPLAVHGGASRGPLSASTWTELTATGARGPLALRVRPAAVLEVTASIAARR